MKKGLLVGTGTLVGVTAVLLLNPDSAPATAAAGSTPVSNQSGSGSASSGGSSATAPSTGSGSGGSSSGGSSSTTASGTYTGETAWTQYGPVQVAVTVSSGKVTNVATVQLPGGDFRSQRISEVAGPMLVQQALASQSAQIDGVSGATYTSGGFAQSLQSALGKAGLV